MVVYSTDDAAHVIDLPLVTDLEIKPAKNGSRKLSKQLKQSDP